MAERLRIHKAGYPDAETPLKRQPTFVGRDADCQVRIDHPEIQERVAALDYRGGAWFVQNLCGYVVYVGPRAVPPQSSGEWRANEELRLSQSVSLTLIVDAGPAGVAAAPVAAAEKPAPADAAAQRRKKLIQIGVILICTLLVAVLLTAPQKQPPVSTHDDFATLVELLKTKQPSDGMHDNRAICDYLQSAWLNDRRCRESKEHNARNRAEAIRLYRLLLKELLLPQKDRLEGDDVYNRVKVFAAQRIAELSKTE
jgi:hypothetical protein